MSNEDRESGRDRSGTDRVRADTTRRGTTIKVVSRPEASSLKEAARMLGGEAGEILRPPVVRRHNGTFRFALMPGDRRISWPKLRAVVGVNKSSLPSVPSALEATGYERGTITPSGSTTASPVLMNERVLGRRMGLGAGAHGANAWVQADDLAAGLDAVTADITMGEGMPDGTR
ncbi:MAG: YbaK/EbsC family protein [Salinibacterium sp.]|nr:YbaK/EbsC family protein [Salinibacterium sp.]